MQFFSAFLFLVTGKALIKVGYQNICPNVWCQKLSGVVVFVIFCGGGWGVLFYLVTYSVLHNYTNAKTKS